MPRKRPVEERFWEKVQKAGPDECWEWVALKSEGGYGLFNLNGDGLKRAHRVSWSWANGGVDPGELKVCHSCDNPGCVNPNHLWIGTHIENHQDMVAKDRQAKGVHTNKAKLTEQQILKIRNSDKTNKELGKVYGISHQHISKIKTRKNWKHLP